MEPEAVRDSKLNAKPLIFEGIVEVLERFGAHVDDVGVWAHLVRKTEFSGLGQSIHALSGLGSRSDAGGTPTLNSIF